MEYTVLTPSQLALHLRSLRKARNLSQAELGAKLGVNQARVGKIERAPGAVSVAQFMQLLSLLGVRLVLKDSASVPEERTPTNRPSTW